MAGKDDLFQLIHSLSKTEKRYFKVQHAQGTDSAANFLRLFDAINKMKAYNEEDLYKKFKGEKLLNNLTKEKAYLYQSILKSMRAYRKDKSSEVRIRELLTDAVFLRERSLYEQCRHVLRKAKKMAYSYENYSSLLEILFQERELLKNLKPRNGATQMKELARETAETLEALQTQCGYLELYDNLFFQTVRSSRLGTQEGREMLRMVMEHPFVQNEKNARTFHDQHRLLSIKAMNARLNLLPAESFIYNKEIVDLWKSNDLIRKENIYIYRNLLSNLLNSCFGDHQYEIIPEIIEELKKIPPKNHHDEGTVFKHVYLAQLNYFIISGAFEEASQLIPEIEAGLQQHREAIGESRLLTFYANIAILFFLMDDYEQSLHWVNEIIHLPKSLNRLDIQRAARLLQLPLHYELKNFTLLENLHRSIKRYVKGLNDPIALEEIVLRNFRKLLNIPRSQQKALFDEWATEIDQLKEDEKEQKVIGFSLFDYWIQAKIQGLSVSKVYLNGQVNAQ